MKSIIEGYEYDIFISYRQKDNKHGGWVTQFVDELKGELEATFKETVSVYFDENPHDRLQETHHVAKSLEGKLKCVIFIPILSQTYCDPGSYAWQFELVPFNKMAAADQFGKEVKLRGGNYASRILPIRIHDLETEDIELFQQETGSVLRAMDFVFKTAQGVNRPLKPDDNPEKNLNGTYYRDQVNKVAHAIKEIIFGMKTGAQQVAKEETVQKVHAERIVKKFKLAENAKTGKTIWQEIFSWFLVAAFLILAGIYLYPKIFKKDRKDMFSAKGEITVAVMPFQNLTNDATRNFWEVMIQDNLITSLSNARELKIRQTESVLSLFDNADLANYASLTPALARSISQKLDANIFVQGSINQIGEITRLNARLIDSKTEEVFKSFQIEGSPENILLLSDSLSRIIRDYLIVELLKKEIDPIYQSLYESTTSPEAFYYLLEGHKSFRKRDYNHATEMYLKVLEIDSTHVVGMIYLASAYGNQGYFAEARKWSLKAYESRNNVSRGERLALEGTYALYFETPNEVIKYYRQLLEIDDQFSIGLYLIGLSYNWLGQYDKAIPELEKALEINKKWGSQILWTPNYTVLGEAYHKTGQFRKEQRLYKKAEKDFPNDRLIISRQAILALARGKTKQADEYLAKFESIGRNLGASEATIQSELGYMYSEAGKLDKAEEYYRNALLLEPEDPWRMRNLANLLIENELNINEGMKLIEKALELRPDSYTLLQAKGLGLFKQGEYQEALNVLQKSWDIRMEHARYNHEAFLHLEEAKKAIAKLR